VQVRQDGRMSLVLPALSRACILMENNSNTQADQLPRKRFISQNRTPEVSETCHARTET